jgi:hypothetical protein
MASLPALTLGRTKTDNKPSASQVDTKLTLARRLRDEDQARRASSIAPPMRTR